MFSKGCFFIGLFIILYASLIFYPKWNKYDSEATIGWDVSGYYWYLPSLFIYKDLKQQQFGDSLVKKYTPTPTFEQSFVHESGNRVMVYSAGMAVMYLPFFTAAHLVAEPLGYRPDGFTFPYQLAIQLGSLMVCILGLWYFRKLLLLYSNDTVTGIMLLLLVIGSNYLNYGAIESALTHNWLFTIYVFILLNTHYFHLNPSRKYAVRIGILCGIAVLIRPSELICVLIPLLWGMESISWAAIRKQLRFLHAHRSKIILAGSILVAIGMIQVIYWLYTAGEPFVYSYQNKGFSWKHPHFKDYIFGYRSGWLMYTPLLALSFAGVIPFLFRGKNKVAVLTFFFLNLYIVCAWDVWWYGGRAMVQSYPVLWLPFAALLQYVFSLPNKWKWVITVPLAGIVLVCTYINIWYTYHAHRPTGLYDSDLMNKKYYWNVIGRYKVHEDVLKLVDTDELFKGTPKDTSSIYRNSFNIDTAGNATGAVSDESFLLVHGNTTEEYSFPYTGDEGDWIRVQATYKYERKEFTWWKLMILVVRFKNGSQIIKERILRPGRFMNENEQKRQYFDVKIPNAQFDTVSILLINDLSEIPMWVYDLRVWSFKE